MTTRDIFDRSAGLITAKRVFGDPYTSDGITVIPVASIRGAGGEAKAFATRGDARMRPTAQQVQPGWPAGMFYAAGRYHASACPSRSDGLLVVVAAAAAVAASAVALGVAGEQLWRGWHWPVLVFAAGEKARSRCSDRCGCSASRSDVSTGRFGGPVR